MLQQVDVVHLQASQRIVDLVRREFLCAPINLGHHESLLSISALRQRGIGILITDHNVRETFPIIDRAYLIYDGQIVMSGTAKELTKDPKAREIYLGADFKM